MDESDEFKPKSGSKRRRLIPQRSSIRITWNELEGRFVRYIDHECGLSENTRDAYCRDIVQFFAWLGDRYLVRSAPSTAGSNSRGSSRRT